jgi:hypothetical protein
MISEKPEAVESHKNSAAFMKNDCHPEGNEP